MPEKPLYELVQEHSLELPLGYVTSAGPPRVGVVFHAFHIVLLPEFRAYLEHMPVPADLFISTDTQEKRVAIEACFADWAKGSFELRVMPNRGRDVAPKLVGFADMHERYDYVLHLHTKSSLHDVRLEGWRGYLLDTLIGSPAVIHGVFEAFARAPRLGMLAPQHIDALRPWIRWGDNYAQATALAGRMDFPLPQDAPLDFPSGSMFWARSAALRPLLDLHLSFDDFPIEAGQTDGTLAHAIERLYFLVCEQAGFDWLKISARGELHEQRGVTAISSPQDLDRFLTRHRLRLASLRSESRPIGNHPINMSPCPMPRRVLHVAWRAALGEAAAVPLGRRLVVAVHGAASPALLRSIEVALELLPVGTQGEMVVVPDATRAAAQQAGFAAGADLVLLIGAPGLLHPQSALALLRMSEAYEGRALLEVAGIGALKLQPVDKQNFSLSLALGPAIAVPRSLYEAIGEYDECLGIEAGDEDYSRRARAHGFHVLLCPRALFYAGAPPAAAAELCVA